MRPLVLAAALTACAAPALQPGPVAFELVGEAAVSSPAGPIRVRLLTQGTPPGWTAERVGEEIAVAMRSFGGIGDPALPVHRWTVIVADPNAPTWAWMCQDAGGDTAIVLGCSLAWGALFPDQGAAPDENQIAVNASRWADRAGRAVTIRHEATHVLLEHATGDYDAAHATPRIWDGLR